MSNKTNIFIGAKFYKYKEDGSLEVIRVIRVKSEKMYVVIKDNDTSLKYIKTADELHEYGLLRSDAIYTFSIVVNAEDNVQLRDIIVTMSRKKDKNEPYVVCRQMMHNMYSHMVTTDTVLGCCVSQDSCPADVNFKSTLICNQLVKTVSVHGYFEDMPEVILKLAEKLIRQGDKILAEQRSILGDAYKGLCSSVKELLEENLFWEEVNKGLKITKLNDKIENCSLNLEQLTYLEEDISYLMDKVHVVEYGPDIDFSQLKSDYMLIRDSENKLYFVSFLRGSFIKQEHLSEEELEKFNSIKI